ncbi:MAG TPA: hypothetical protein VHP36_01480 [Chitinispirillaceae bacterium]|nr:hypothetical protein [Chitinispirillaceae bacterium]
MGSKHCRLYDENLVHNIMLSTGLSILEYLKDNKNVDSDDICEFIEMNAGSIIEDTIQQLNNDDELPGQESSDSENDQWPFNNPGSEGK